jgi:adenine-specific DNA-methyltransferase
MPRSRAKPYLHRDEALLRPEVGTQAQFRKRKPPKTYRYDSSLSPALDWDGQNSARELGEWLLAQIEEAAALAPPHLFVEPRRFGDVEVSGLHDTIARLKVLSMPFLDWAGKAERLSFDVPTLPLFVHERLSTKAILETLTSHKRDRQMELTLFGDPQLPLHEQLEAYEHKGGWVNRMILGDSLVVMNSLLEYEGLGGQVQAIYMDPPYGVKFGSNFQPFVRKRDVKDADDDSMTREPEMVKAYRDTWELGLHSYLTYLRDRLLVARELLTPSGSVFVQISDENVHHVRSLLDDVFGAESFCRIISFAKTAGLGTGLVPVTQDYLLWYCVDLDRVKFRQLYLEKFSEDDPGMYTNVDTDGRPYRADNLTSANNNVRSCLYEYEYDGKTFRTPATAQWKTTREGMDRLRAAGRLVASTKGLYYKRYLDDFPVRPATDRWIDTGSGGFTEAKIYAVQTNVKVIQRCLLMTTDPGDLVLDPTCGSGTTAYVAEQWGRRWITIDTSRVPLALAKQRLLTATFPYYELQDTARGPGGGFVYKRKQNKKGDEVGGIVPHIMLKSIANDEPPAEEVLVDRPEIDGKITRVSGPFAFEATIPTPVDLDGDRAEDTAPPDDDSFLDRMLEVLRRSKTIHLPGNQTLTLDHVRPATTLTLSAEAELEGGETVGIVIGPENGAVSEKLVYEAAREAYARKHARLFVIGFAIEANARAFVEKTEGTVGVAAVYVQATPDLVMGDLLKTSRSSQIFSVAGMPEVKVHRLPPEAKGGPARFQVELLALDVFDPVTMDAHHLAGDNVPAWFLDTDWNDLSFHISQAFFPRTGAWDNLRKALKGDFEESVWEHLAGTTSAPFTADDSGKVAVKVVDDRGNELLVVKDLSEAV